MKKFNAKIIKLGINPCVNVPEKIVKSLLCEAQKTAPPIQVKGTLDGKSFKTNIVRYQGACRLYLNMQMRKDANVDIGDSVRIFLTYDSARRTAPMPEELKIALAQNKKAKERWHMLSNSRRKEILAYLNSLKSKASRERNVQKVIKLLTK